MAYLNFKGVFPPAITPFNSTGDVNESSLLDFLDFLVGKGVHGIFLLGTNGEAPLLSFEEKKKIMRVAVEHIGGKIPIIAGVGATNTRESIELAKFAERVGADAIHAITPYYYPVDSKGLLKHYEKIARNVELPLFIYYFPQRTGIKITKEDFIQLLKIENVVGMKDSSQDVAWFYEIVKETKKGFSFFCGSDTLIYTYFHLGAEGVVSMVSNVFPELVVQLFNKFQEGEYEEAKKLQDKIVEIRSAIEDGPYMSGVKAALKLRGIDAGEPRSPLRAFGKEEMDRLKRRLHPLLENEDTTVRK